jgi:hypothetical protein
MAIPVRGLKWPSKVMQANKIFFVVIRFDGLKNKKDLSS